MNSASSHPPLRETAGVVGPFRDARLWTSLLALGVAGTLWASPPMLEPGSTRAIADNVFLIPDRGVSLVPNVGIVVGADSVLVIDTGMGPANAEVVLGEVAAVSPLPIRYLVTTHFHPEHNYGAQSFPDDAILIYSERQHQDLLNKGEPYREWFVEMFGDDVRELLAPVRLVQPDVTFVGKALFDLGALPVELYDFGEAAHTGGDTVVYLPEQKVAFAGGLVPNGFFPIFPDADSSVSGWLKSLDALERIGAELLIPDHGPPAGPELIGTIREYLQAVQSQAGEMRGSNVPLEQAQKQLTEQMTGLHPDWGEPHWIGLAVERAYAEAQAGN